MVKFTFRFQAVLRQRQLAEEEQQRELAKVLRHRMILLDQLRLMQETISRSKRDLGDCLTGKVDLDRVAQFARFSGQATQRAQQIVTKLAAVEQQVEQARARLLQATAARKAIDLLRERHYRTWREEQDRRETMLLDELAGQAYTRQMLEAIN